MAIIIILIAISLSIAILFLAVFYWSMRTGQFDDTYTPSVRMLFDDKATNSEGKQTQQRARVNLWGKRRAGTPGEAYRGLVDSSGRHRR